MYVNANAALVNNTTVHMPSFYVAPEQQPAAGLLSQLSSNSSSSSSSSTAAAASFSGLPTVHQQQQQQQQQQLSALHARPSAVGDDWLLLPPLSIGDEEEDDVFVDVDKLLEDVIDLSPMQPCMQQQQQQQALGCSSGPAPSMLDLLLQP
jgi:hypothetical protein